MVRLDRGSGGRARDRGIPRDGKHRDGPLYRERRPRGPRRIPAFAVPVLGGYLLLALLLPVLSWGLRSGRIWTRPRLLATAVEGTAFGPVVAFAGGAQVRDMITALTGGALMLGSLWWYLFRDDAVVG